MHVLIIIVYLSHSSGFDGLYVGYFIKLSKLTLLTVTHVILLRLIYHMLYNTSYNRKRYFPADAGALNETTAARPLAIGKG